MTYVKKKAVKYFYGTVNVANIFQKAYNIKHDSIHIKYEFRKLSHWLMMTFPTIGHRNGKNTKFTDMYSCPCSSLYPGGWVHLCALLTLHGVGNSICHM